MSHAWCFRFDGSYKDAKAGVDYLESICDVLIIYEHPAKPNSTKEKGGVHIHGFCTSDSTNETIRNNFKAKVNIKGNTKGYASEARRGLVPNISYMSKGKYDPVFVKNVDDVLITNGKALGFDKNEITKVEGEEQVFKAQKTYTQYHLCNEAIAECVWIKNESKEMTFDVIERIFEDVVKLANRRHQEGKLKKQPNKIIREIAESVVNWYFPEVSAKSQARTWWSWNMK